MEVLNIFLAGSTKLEEQRNIFRSCANRLQADNCAKGRNIAVNITTFENFNSGISEIKSQELYDAYIHSEADYAMFIFDNEVGGISKHEFDIAFDAFQKNKRPTLYIYFKNSCSYSPEYEEIRSLLLNTGNYFIQYDDIAHLRKLVDTHMREMLDPIVEKIIIDSCKGKGKLTLTANSDCTVTENGIQTAILSADIPHTSEFTEGVHTLSFQERSSSKIIERKIKVMVNSTRNIRVEFEAEKHGSTTAETNSKVAYFIIPAILILVIGALLKFSSMQNEQYEYPDDIIELSGGEMYQQALRAIDEEQYSLAVELLTTVITNEPTFAAPYIHLASIHYNQYHNIDKALEMVNSALELDPANPWANDLRDRILDSQM